MNPHAHQPVSPSVQVAYLRRHRDLLLRLIRRDVAGRYRGSALGLLWSFITPIVLLLTFTFVFTVVFTARWGVDTESPRGVFALNLFAGLIMHGIIADVLTRAPGLILGHGNYVKKIVFPLGILPLVPLGSALFHAVVSVIVLAVAQLIILGSLPWTYLLLPVVVLPLVLVSAGMSWFLAATGVYLRDIGQTMGLAATLLLFLSPIFYPLSAIPESFQPIILANPLTFIIEQSRQVLLMGELPDLAGLAIYSAVAAIVAWGGFAWFLKTQKGFADVL